MAGHAAGAPLDHGDGERGVRAAELVALAAQTLERRERARVGDRREHVGAERASRGELSQRGGRGRVRRLGERRVATLRGAAREQLSERRDGRGAEEGAVATGVGGEGGEGGRRVAARRRRARRALLEQMHEQRDGAR